MHKQATVKKKKKSDRGYSPQWNLTVGKEAFGKDKIKGMAFLQKGTIYY